MSLKVSDIIGRPWQEIEPLLRSEGIAYERKMARPQRDFFETDERRFYVVRARQESDGIWKIVLSARLKASYSVQDREDGSL